MHLTRLVIGIDDSPGARSTAKWSLTHTADGADIHLVHVDAGNTNDAAAKTTLAELTGLEWGKRNVRTHTVQHHDIAECLTERAAEFEAEAVVIGVRSRHRHLPHVVGSIAAHLHHARQHAVIAVRANGAPSPKVCVGVDGTDGSWAALRWIIDCPEAGSPGGQGPGLQWTFDPGFGCASGQQWKHQPRSGDTT